MSTRFDGIAEFVAVMRLGSFTAAASELGVNKSAIGRAVSRLENRLGTKLLHRTTRRLTLTSAGEVWFKHSTAALDELDCGESALVFAKDMPSGNVRIDLPTGFGRLRMMPVLLQVAERFPGLNLNVSFADRRVDLVSKNIDLVVRIGNLDDSTDLVARPIGVQRQVIVGAPSYLARRGVPRSRDDLKAHDCIVGLRHGKRIAWLMRQPDGSTVQQDVPVKHEFQDYETVLMGVKAGLGLTELPSWMVQDDVRSGTLQIILDGLSGGELPINILWPRTKTLPAKIRVVVDGMARWRQGLSTSVIART
jgi:DNA-binding transcriptional LysR family regulator